MANKKSKSNTIIGIGVIYARFSSHNQRDVSIDQQVDAGRIKASEYGVQITKVYADRAISGKTDKRTDFQRMMRDAEKGEFQFVIAWKSNRMGRNMLEAMINEAKLNSLGIRVIYVEENFDDSAAGRFAARSMMNVNQFYSESMAEDIVRGMYDNANKCMVTNGKLPFGYVADKETLLYLVDENKAEIVREIFTRVAVGDAFVDIANSLNARGIKTSNGGKWGKSSFRTILMNERYRGIYIYGDVRKEGGIPRIVSDELFFKVQEVLKTKKNAQGRHRMYGDYSLTGKLFCGKCKAPMIGMSGTSKTGTLHHYYVCQSKRNLHTCDKENVRRDDIEIAVAQAIKDYALQSDVIDWIADSTVAYNKKQEELSHISLLEDELDTTKKAIKNLLSAIEQGIITDATKGRLLELEAEQAQISAKISAERANIITVSRKDIIAGLSMFRDGDINNNRYRAKLFDTFLVAVYIYDDDLKIVFSFTGDKNTVTIPLDFEESEEEYNEKAKSSHKLSFAPP